MLKSARVALTFAALTAPALSACVAIPRSEIEEAHTVKTICEAVKPPSGSDGFKVIIAAEFISDRKERSFLQDETCPNIVVVPYDAANVVKDEGYEAFARRLDANPLQVGLVRVRVTIYGTLRREAPTRYRLDVIRYIEAGEGKTR